MKTIKDFVYVDNIFSKELCENVLFAIETEDKKWVEHSWHNESLNTITPKFNGIDQDYKELEVLYHNLNDFSSVEQLLLPSIVSACENYCKLNAHDSQMVLSSLSNFRFNRYHKDSLMQNHYDHIHTLFTPPVRGIPVLSFVGILNDNFSGGEFILFDDYTISPRQGDIIIFPSNFMFPHRVNKITEGTRYSFVAWGY